MATTDLTTENFNDVAGSGSLVLIDFWADWCGPCRMFAPIYEEASERHDDVVFGSVDTEAEPEIAGAFEIASIPTLMIIREGIVLHRESGALPAKALEELIGKARAIDMDDVRQQIAKQEAS